MAENIVPLRIEENVPPISDDLAVQQRTDSLTIPETNTSFSLPSIVQTENKVDLDIDKARGAGLTTPEITRFLVQDLYKYQDQDNNYQSLPAGYYDSLRSNGKSDSEILSTFANVRDVSPTMQFMESAAKAFTPSATMMTGATLGSPFGIPGMIIGGGAGLIAGDSYRRMMAPELDLPYADKSGLAVSGEIVGGTGPGFQLPWLVGDSAVNFGSNFIRNNLQNLPYQKPIATGLSRAETFVGEGFQAARNNPLGYAFGEGRDLFTAAGVGAATEELARGDRGGVNAAGDLVAEVGAVMIDPVGRGSRFITNRIPLLRNMFEGLSPDRRALAAGQRLRTIIEQSGEDPEAVITKLLAGTGEYAGNDYTKLLDEVGINFDDRTAALQTGVPVLYLLESQGLETSRKKAGQALEFNPDPEIRNTQQRAQRSFNQFLGDLLEMDTPESLGLFADLRDEKYRSTMNDAVTTAFDRYQTTVNKALEGGETLDTRKVLFETFFGEDGNGGVLGDITRQGNVLKNLIPKDVEVDAGTLSIPDTEGDLFGQGLVDVYNRIGEQASIRGQRPRLSYGQDLVSIDRVLKEFDVFVNPEKYVKAETDVPQLPKETQLDLIPAAKVVDDVVPEGEENRVTTGELLNFLDGLDRAKRDAMRKGNQPLLELLTEVENGTKNTLEMVSKHRNVTTRGGQFSTYFDNYLSYRDEASNVFSNALLGEMRTKVPPELAGTIIFKGMGDPTMLRLQQLDDAANFLLNYNERNVGTLTASNELAEVPLPVKGKPGEFEKPILDAAQAVEVEEALNIVPNIRGAQERVLRGILDDPKFFRRTVERNEVGEPIMIPDPNDPTKTIPKETIEQTAAFNTFLADPATQNILDNYFPTLKSDLEDVSKTRTLFDNLQSQESLLNESIENQDAFTSLFAGVYDNPIKVVQDIIGTPGQRILSRTNPVQDLTKIAKTVASSDDPKVVQGFLDAIINHAYVYSGASAPVDLATGAQPFNLEKFKQALFQPIVPGRRSSVADVLTDTGILEEGDAHLAKISQVLNEMDKIQKSLSPARSAELGTILPEDLQNVISTRIAEAGVGAIGAGIAANMYGLLAKAGIVGGAGSLITSALGANLAREIVTRNPSILAGQLMTEMIKKPKIMAEILTLARDYKPGEKLPTDKLRSMYTFLLGGGLVPAGIEFKEFATNYYGSSEPLAPQRERRSAEERLQQAAPAPVVPAPAPAPAPAPPPVAQAPQAPAPGPSDPNQRARYAAMYPFDTASDVIRTQGIGSLGA